MFRQIFHRIDRFALIADFEMQLDLVAIGIAHFGNLLAPFHQLFFLDQTLPLYLFCHLFLNKILVFLFELNL